MRLQLALNVTDLDRAIEFYSKMFATTPNKTRPGYANFVVEQPPLKLVLFEADGDAATGFEHLNHLGVEVETTDQVVEAERRLSSSSIETTGVDETQCCYAEKTETWVTSPEGARWEWYVRTGDVEQFENVSLGGSDTACCG